MSGAGPFVWAAQSGDSVHLTSRAEKDPTQSWAPPTLHLATLTPARARALARELLKAAHNASVKTYGLRGCDACGAFDGTHTTSCTFGPALHTCEECSHCQGCEGEPE